MSKRHPVVILTTLLILLIFVNACSTAKPVTTSIPSVVIFTPTMTTSPVASTTPVPPTPTEVPLAAVVNGEPITLAEYEAEVDRYEAAATITGTILASDTITIVMDDLIDQTLFAQAAAENEFTVDDTLLQSKIDALQTQLGGSQALDTWVTAHGYSEEAFKQALRRSVGAAWMRDQVIGAVPETTEQVHGMQILLSTAAEADEVYAALQSGKDFLDLALTYDPLTGGDLGWFPRGYLDDPVIDEAIFSLQPGEYSQVVETEIGFHILFVAEKDANHTLQPAALAALQINALKEWLIERRNQSEIQVFVH